LWSVANGPELLNADGTPSGIAEAFTNPVQHIREDFGTARLDQNFTQNDSFAAVYTADDSAAHSPTSNPLTFVDSPSANKSSASAKLTFFRRVFSNKATFGFSRGNFYFDSGTIPQLSAWIHDGQPVAPSSWAAALPSMALHKSPTAAPTLAVISAPRAISTQPQIKSPTPTAFISSSSAAYSRRFKPTTHSFKTNTAKFFQ